MVAQVIQGHAVQIAAQILGSGDLAAAEFLKRSNGGILQDVRGELRIAHPAQDQRTETRKVAID